MANRSGSSQRKMGLHSQDESCSAQNLRQRLVRFWLTEEQIESMRRFFEVPYKQLKRRSR